MSRCDLAVSKDEITDLHCVRHKLLLPLSISTIKTVEERVYRMGGRLSCHMLKIPNLLKLLPYNFSDTLLSKRGSRHPNKGDSITRGRGRCLGEAPIAVAMPSLVFGAGVTVSGRCAGALSIAGGNGVGNGIGKITDAGPWK
jgi:hypothetical protein